MHASSPYAARHDLAAVARMFALQGDFAGGAPYGNGHINDTYTVNFNQAGTLVRYIFQRVNHKVFKDPVALMDNVARVTAHARRRLAEDGDAQASRKALTTVPALDGRPFAHDAAGNLWRLYLFIERATGYDLIERPRQAREAARAFGNFQRLLADLPGARLHETIPDFHHTRKRFAALLAAVEADPLNRAAAMRAEIDFALAREADAGRLVAAMEAGEIPERVTHNDTKLNNVLIDDASGEGVCVIDLDTTMPGCALYDFGDMVRSATNSAAEDETDPAKIHCRIEIFEALAEGYLSSARAFLTPAEVSHLVFAGKLLTFECGIRFLTDYLSGDVYFKIKHPEHNRDRCRNQFALVRSLEAQAGRMEEIVRRLLESPSYALAHA
jgi:Ser/Thr protein kinase RdoA (MazF antagonist)